MSERDDIIAAIYAESEAVRAVLTKALNELRQIETTEHVTRYPISIAEDAIATIEDAINDATMSDDEELWLEATVETWIQDQKEPF